MTNSACVAIDSVRGIEKVINIHIYSDCVLSPESIVSNRAEDGMAWFIRIPVLEDLSADGEVEELEEDLPHIEDIMCVKCGHLLTACKMQQTLRLPSENWQEFVDFWTCACSHYDISLDAIKAQRSFVFFAPTYLLLCADDTCLDLQSTKTLGNPVHCPSCESYLGYFDASSQGVKLLRHCITSPALKVNLSLENLGARFILEKMRAQGTQSFALCADQKQSGSGQSMVTPSNGKGNDHNDHGNKSRSSRSSDIEMLPVEGHSRDSLPLGEVRVLSWRYSLAFLSLDLRKQHAGQTHYLSPGRRALLLLWKEWSSRKFAGQLEPIIWEDNACRCLWDQIKLQGGQRPKSSVTLGKANLSHLYLG